MRKNRFSLMPFFLFALCEFVLIGLPVPNSIWNKILASTTLMVTAILGTATYVQTRQELRLGEIDKVPFMKFVDITKDENVLANELTFKDYNLAKFISYNENFNPEDRPGMYLVVKDSKDKKTMRFCIMAQILNVTMVPLSKVSIHCIYNNQLIHSGGDYLIENIFKNAGDAFKSQEQQYRPIFEGDYFSLTGNEKKTIWIDMPTEYNDNEVVAFKLRTIFVCETVYADKYYQETDLDLYLDKQSDEGVNIIRILHDETHSYSAKDFSNHMKDTVDKKLKNELKRL